MARPRRRWIWLGSILVVLLAGLPAAWFSLTYRPKAYRQALRGQLPPEQRRREAKRFVSHSLQLRSDMTNEPNWEAVFTDEEVNAWLEEDLVTSFADQLPPEVHEPRVVFEDGRAIVAFELDRGPIRSVITVVGRLHVPEDNVLALTIEKIQAGIIPLSVDTWTDRIGEHVRRYGVNFVRGRDGQYPVAYFRYTTDPSRHDVVLERVSVTAGQLRLGGRSQPGHGRIASPVLPSRRILQSTFPRRTFQVPSRSSFRTSTSPRI